VPVGTAGVKGGCACVGYVRLMLIKLVLALTVIVLILTVIYLVKLIFVGMGSG
jgi:hypothetical protein